MLAIVVRPAKHLLQSLAWWMLVIAGGVDLLLCCCLDISMTVTDAAVPEDRIFIHLLLGGVPLSRWVHHYTTTLQHTGHIAGQRRRAPDTPGVNHRPAARETTNPGYHSIYLLGDLNRMFQLHYGSKCSSPSTICRIQAPNQRWSWSQGILCGQACKRIAAPGPVLASPASQSLPSHNHSIGRLYTASSTFPACTHRCCGTPSDVGGLHVLPHCSRPLYSLARSHPHPGHHSRHRGMCPADWLDISLRLPTDYHHWLGMSVRILAFLIPGQAVWHSALTDDRPPPCG
jgi:hypothetical protein